MHKHLLIILLGFGSIQYAYSEDLISIMDFIGSPEAKEMEIAERALFAVEKCSALTFISIGGDNPDVEDVGDIFLQRAFKERMDAEPEIDPRIHLEVTRTSIQNYFEEYQQHAESYLDERTDDDLFSELMKDDLEFCIGAYKMISPQESLEE